MLNINFRTTLALFISWSVIINIVVSVTMMCQSDFAHGTYRIRTPGIYQLCENIVFNPNQAPDLTAANTEASSWFPQDNVTYPTSNAAFVLGFFTAITIECNNVEIDLNNFEIRMHDYFHFQQRFFSIIEVANVPVENGQGQANFGNISYVSNIKIHNGKLGKSSHHGIHSNGVSNITITNLHIYDFEVAGIHLNNFRNATIQNVEIGPCLQNVSVNPYYSNARFLLMKLGMLNNRIPNSLIKFSDRPTTSYSVTYLYNNLLRYMNLIFSYFNQPNTVSSRKDALLLQSRQLFESTSKLPDGATLYGILLNSWGPAVFGFGYSPNTSHSININNVSIHDLYHSPQEVIGYYYESNDQRVPLRGPFGEQINMFSVCNNYLNNNPFIINSSIDNNYLINQKTIPNLYSCSYLGNPLSDAQMAIGLFGINALDEIGLAFVSNDFLNWVQKNTSFNNGAHVKCNGDIMGHTIKGTIGIRVDNTINAKISNVDIFNIENHSNLGSKLCGEYYSDADEGANYGTLNGFMGTNLRGISVVNSNNVEINNFNINNLNSYYGDVIGIDLFDGVSSINITGNNSINNLNAGSHLQTSLESQKSFNPNHDPFVCGIEYDNTDSFTNTDINGIEISNLQGYDACINQFTAINVELK